MFLNFESPVSFGIPMGFLLLIRLICFMLKIFSLKDFYYLVNQILYHFYNSFFPRAWLMLFLFFSILLINVYRLVPGTFSLSSLPLITLRIRVIMWRGGYLYCLTVNFSRCVRHFLPQRAPIALSILLVWIEILSWLCRPVALRVRLMANITAGHLLMFLCGSGVFFSRRLFLFPIVFLIALVGLEVRVAFIQSYVYQLLLSLYIGERLD